MGCGGCIQQQPAASDTSAKAAKSEQMDPAKKDGSAKIKFHDPLSAAEEYKYPTLELRSYIGGTKPTASNDKEISKTIEPYAYF